MSFLWPFVFILLPLPWLVRQFTKPTEQPLNGALQVPFFQQLNASHVGGASASRTKRFSWQHLLAWLIWLCLLTALARPVLIGKEVPLPADGRDIMMAIDLSGSMKQQDFQANGEQTTRLNVVKATADAFITRRKGDRLGLILFSDRAYLQAPLTFDRKAVTELLTQAEVGLTGQKTAIGDAIAVAVKRLQDRPDDSRVLILLTDGASNAGAIQPLEAAKIASELGIRIYTIGVGSGQLVINTPFGQQRINMPQDLDENTLKAVANITGGQYFRAADTQSLQAIYQAIDKLEPAAGEPIYLRPETALYFWPASFALFLMGLWGALVLASHFSASRFNKNRPQDAAVSKSTKTIKAKKVKP